MKPSYRKSSACSRNIRFFRKAGVHRGYMNRRPRRSNKQFQRYGR